MSENPYPDLSNQPLLANNRAPPPPPRAVNNPSFNAPNPSFNAPNPSFNNPNPSFNNPNPVFVNNPNPNFNNPNPVYVNNPNYPPNLNNNPYPNNNPYNPNYPNQVGSVGNYQVIRNNGPYVQNFGVNVNCLLCRRETSSITRKTPGGVTWIWCFVLFIVTGVCCCIPFCVDSCQDTEIVCVNCQTVKSRIQANCC